MIACKTRRPHKHDSAARRRAVENRRVLRAISGGHVTFSAIGRATGLRIRVLMNAMDRLRNAGEIESTGMGTAAEWSIIEAGEPLK